MQRCKLKITGLCKTLHSRLYNVGITQTLHLEWSAIIAILHRQSGVWHEAGFVDFGLASCSREFPRLRARNAPTWPSEAQCTKPGVMGSL